MQGVFGVSEHKLASGSAAVYAMLWLPPGIVAATPSGIITMPAATNSRPQVLARPSAAGDGPCHLSAIAPHMVLAAWQHTVQVLQVSSAGSGAAHGAAKLQLAGGTAAQVHAQVLHTFSVADSVLGAAPFGPALLLLVQRNSSTAGTAGECGTQGTTNGTAADGGYRAADHATTARTAGVESCHVQPAGNARSAVETGSEQVAQSSAASCAVLAAGDSSTAHSNGAHDSSTAQDTKTQVKTAGTADASDLAKNGNAAPAVHIPAKAQACLQVVSTSGQVSQQIDILDAGVHAATRARACQAALPWFAPSA